MDKNNLGDGQPTEETELSAMERLHASAPAPAEFKSAQDSILAQPLAERPSSIPMPSGTILSKTDTKKLSKIQPPFDEDEDKPSRKWLWIGISIAAVLLLLVGSVIISAMQGDKKKPTKTAESSGSSNSETAPHAYLYYVAGVAAGGTKGNFSYDVVSIDPVNKSSSTAKLKTTWPLSNDNADPIQFSSDGQKFAYATSDSSDDGHTAEPNSYQLTFGEWQGTTKAIIDGRTPGDIVDWKLTADGQEVAYIEKTDTGNKLATFTLYSYSARNGQTTNLGAISRPSDRGNTSLFEVESDKTIRLYTTLDDGIYESKYDRSSAKVTSKRIAAKKYETSGSMGALSPDGSKLVYYGYPDSGANGIVVHVINTISGNVSTLISNTDQRLGYSTGAYPSWSSDSSKLLLSVLPFGTEASEMENFPNELLAIDADSGERRTLASNQSPGGFVSNALSAYTPIAWSRDDKYLAYTQDNRLYVYDTTTSKVVSGVSKAIANNHSELSLYHFIWTKK